MLLCLILFLWRSLNLFSFLKFVLIFAILMGWFLLVYLPDHIYVLLYHLCVCVSCSVMSDSLWPHGLQPTRLLCSWDSPGKNTGLPCPPPGDLPSPGIKSQSHDLHLLHWQASSLPLAPPEMSNISYVYSTNIYWTTLYIKPCAEVWWSSGKRDTWSSLWNLHPRWKTGNKQGNKLAR